jgi:hypothetical protein
VLTHRRGLSDWMKLLAAPIDPLLALTPQQPAEKTSGS